MEDSQRRGRTYKATLDVYKKLQVDYNVAVKQVWSTGKALHKALEGVSGLVRKHYEAINALSRGATQTSGGVTEVGLVFHDMSEIYRSLEQLHDRQVALMKARFSNTVEFELLSHHQRTSEKQKRYSREHFKLQQSLLTSLKKQGKNKLTKGTGRPSKNTETHKEAQYWYGELDRCLADGLKECLSDEKEAFDFAAHHLIQGFRDLLDCFDKGRTILNNRLDSWDRSLECSDSLYMSGQTMLSSLCSRSTEGLNAVHSEEPAHSHIQSADEESLSVDSESITVSVGPEATSTERLTTEITYVRALHSHKGNGETELSFAEGDIIAATGESKNSWQYGQSVVTGRYGWFPTSFTRHLQHSEGVMRPNNFEPHNKPERFAQKARSLCSLTDIDTQPNSMQSFQISVTESSDNDVLSGPIKPTNYRVGLLSRSTMDIPKSEIAGSSNTRATNAEKHVEGGEQQQQRRHRQPQNLSTSLYVTVTGGGPPSTAARPPMPPASSITAASPTLPLQPHSFGSRLSVPLELVLARQGDEFPSAPDLPTALPSPPLPPPPPQVMSSFLLP